MRKSWVFFPSPHSKNRDFFAGQQRKTQNTLFPHPVKQLLVTFELWTISERECSQCFYWVLGIPGSEFEVECTTKLYGRYFIQEYPRLKIGKGPASLTIEENTMVCMKHWSLAWIFKIICPWLNYSKLFFRRIQPVILNGIHTLIPEAYMTV